MTIIAAGYVGAFAGWAMGFVLAFLFVLAAEHAETRVTCGVCGREYPEGTEMCRWCGAPIGSASMSPLAAEGLHAGSYAVSNALSIIWVAVLAGIAATLIAAGSYAADEYKVTDAMQWGLRIAAGVAVFLVWATASRLLMSAMAESSRRSRKAPDPPSPAALPTLADGAKMLLAVLIFVAPIVTLPLLPVALLRMSRGGGPSVRAAWRMAWQNPRPFAILWLMLLMWLSGSGLAAAALAAIGQIIRMIPNMGGYADMILNVILSAFAAAAGVAVTVIFGLAVSRCIGTFGLLSNVGEKA